MALEIFTVSLRFSFIIFKLVVWTVLSYKGTKNIEMKCSIIVLDHIYIPFMSAESRLTPCDLMDYSLPGPSVHGIFQTRILKWVAISFSRGSYWLGDRTWVFRISCIGRQILYHWAPWEAQYIYHVFFIHSFAELHLGCFHVLAIIILLSHKKEWKWVLCSDVEEPTVCHTK